MSRSSEEVLLIVNNVKHKKSDGSIYMMGQRMAWMQDSKDSFSISHAYADIKGTWHNHCIEICIFVKVVH